MNWLDVAHWMILGCCTTLALVHGLAWLRVRDNPGAAMLAGLAISLAAMTGVEMQLLAAADPAAYGRWIWWMHLPVFGLVVCAVLFIRLHLKAGRRWLAWAALGLRSLVLLVNLVSTPAVNFREVRSVHTRDLLGASVTAADIVPGPGTVLVMVSLLAAIAFLVDATVEIMRRRHGGDLHGLPTALGLTTFAILGTAVVAAPALGWGSVPLLLTIVFTPVLLALALELGLQQLRSVGLARDLDAMRSELLRTERRLALAADAARVSFWEWDPNTKRFWSTRNTPDSAGMTHVDFDTAHQRAHPDDRHLLASALNDSVSTGQPMAVEYRGTDPNRASRDDWRWFVSLGRPVHSRNPAHQVVTGVTLDVTDRKLAELGLQHAKDAAEAASRAKSAFLANMSHELRTPLHAILGYSQAASDADATASQRANLEMVQTASRHLLSLIEDVLDLSRIEAGGLRLQHEDFSLGELLAGVRSLVAARLDEKRLRFSIDGDGVPEWLHGDPQRLRQALLNYVGNAVKFTDSGSIALRCELLSDDAEGLLVRFLVTDTGIGVDPAALPRLFRPFEQADASLTRARQGSGLGLAITRRLAQAMGGEVGADGRPGQGSTFWFTARLQRARQAPVHEAPDAAGDAREALRARHAGARVLLAEDNAVSSRLARRMLEGVGLVVDVAADGAAAVERAAGARHDLILMDLSMPVMDGLAAARAIRSLPQHAHVPIIAVTGNAFDTDRAACEAAGMSAFVTKPIDWPDFWPRLVGWLDSSRSDHANAGANHPA